MEFSARLEFLEASGERRRFRCTIDVQSKRTHHEKNTSIFGSYPAASEPATDDSQDTRDDQGVSQSGIGRGGHQGHVAVLGHDGPDTDATHHQSGQLQHEKSSQLISREGDTKPRVRDDISAV